jgi:hypothetical protein
VRPERFELPTYCSGGNRSIHLSYGRAGSVYIPRLWPSIGPWYSGKGRTVLKRKTRASGRGRRSAGKLKKPGSWLEREIGLVATSATAATAASAAVPAAASATATAFHLGPGLVDV